MKRSKKRRKSYIAFYIAAAITAFAMFLTWEGWKACVVLVFGSLIALLLAALQGEI